MKLWPENTGQPKSAGAFLLSTRAFLLSSPMENEKFVFHRPRQQKALALFGCPVFSGHNFLFSGWTFLNETRSQYHTKFNKILFLNVTNFYGLTGLPFKRLTSFILRPKKILQLKTEITQIERFLKILSCPHMKKSMAY